MQLAQMGSAAVERNPAYTAGSAMRATPPRTAGPAHSSPPSAEQRPGSLHTPREPRASATKRCPTGETFLSHERFSSYIFGTHLSQHGAPSSGRWMRFGALEAFMRYRYYELARKKDRSAVLRVPLPADELRTGVVGETTQVGTEAS
jgi:hypothetical protein